MSKIKQQLKSKLEAFANLLPYGRDLYLTLMRNRLSISYRKIFSEHDAALAEAESTKQGSYDVLNSQKADREDFELGKLGSWQYDYDYPLAFYILKLLKPESRVLEIGGSLGHFFYSMKQLDCVPGSVNWTIAELPEAVSLGARLAKRKQEEQLHFIDSSEFPDADQWDILVSAGTLQYMQEDMPDLISRLQQRPRHVLIHNIPTHESEQFFTLQSLRVCEVPYKIFSKSLLMSRMADLGYQAKSEWLFPRKVEVPFHRSKEILGYMGFYFESQQQVD